MHNIVNTIKKNISKILVGKEKVTDQLLIALLCRGHVLIEDVPGVGKTTLVWSLAKSLDCSFQRIQFTPDVLPSDITGFTMANMKTGGLEFKKGAVFSNIILADEINRTPPKTQSALLEAMQERQVTVDGVTHALPQPFMVMATQNPIEYIGHLSSSRSPAGQVFHEGDYGLSFRARGNEHIGQVLLRRPEACPRQRYRHSQCYPGAE